MSKKLEFTYGGKDYVLEFTRKTVETMERQGFLANQLAETPMTHLPALFRGAFLANHRYLRANQIDEMLDKFTDKENLIGKLAEMYNEPLAALLAEPEEDEGNISWGASW